MRGVRPSLEHPRDHPSSGLPSKKEDKAMRIAKYPGWAPLAFQDFLKPEIFSSIFLKSLSVTPSEDKLGHLKRGLVREPKCRDPSGGFFLPVGPGI